jgi:hypothetical protein
MHTPVPDDCLRVHQIGPPTQRVGFLRQNQNKGPQVKLPQLVKSWLDSDPLPRASSASAQQGTVGHTLLSAGIWDISTLLILAWQTLATSRSFRPHSSVLVARKMHDAATSYNDIS